MISLTELPSPLPNKTGWPWTEASSQLPDKMANGQLWPRVSIITPSYNQGQFIEETIRSVLLQGYPNLEYIIIDGGSTDNSVEIIRKYEPWLAYWVSEKDSGQANAINKGWQRSTGEIVAYLNSDDIYFPNAINSVVAFLQEHPEVDIVYGDCHYVDEQGKYIRACVTEEFNLKRLIQVYNFIPQPSTFIRKQVLTEIGLMDESLHYALDYELWLRATQKFTAVYVPQLWATYRLAIGTKTSYRLQMRREEYQVAHRYGRSLLRWFITYWLPASLRYRGGLLFAKLGKK